MRFGAQQGAFLQAVYAPGISTPLPLFNLRNKKLVQNPAEFSLYTLQNKYDLKSLIYLTNKLSICTISLRSAAASACLVYG